MLRPRFENLAAQAEADLGLRAAGSLEALDAYRSKSQDAPKLEVLSTQIDPLTGIEVETFEVRTLE